MTYKKLFLFILLAICLCLEIPYLPISAHETSASISLLIVSARA